MHRIRRFLIAIFLASPVFAFAQQPAEAAQFDFLIGQWQLDVHPKVSSLAAMIHGAPKLLGTWKAWRTTGGAEIEDEIRIVDASGNPLSSSRSQRTWDAADQQWKITGHELRHGGTSEATGRLQGNEMHLDGHFIDADGTVLTRTRIYDIGADGFRMSQDRSHDNGQSWEEGALTIDAKRVSATATP
ncbi:MAG TPA: hypothetical protein VH082_12635 [Rudaea sp.]|jgi:hypothetical protein|nr:hypothetical protein [Rudaea sp.]